LFLADAPPATGIPVVTMNSFALPQQGGSIECSKTAHPLSAYIGTWGNSSPPVTLGTDPLGFDPMGYSETCTDTNQADYLQTGPIYVHGELNTWHINATPDGKYSARGMRPAGWVIDPGPHPPMPAPPPDNYNYDCCSYWVVDPNDAYPYNPSNPDSDTTRGDLQAGDYIIMRGTLWQEDAHDCTHKDNSGPWSLWRATPKLLYHAGNMEMHPIDWIWRLPTPSVPKTAYTLACIGVNPAQGVAYAGHTFDVSFFPYPKQRPSGAVLRCQEQIDGRFSDMTTVNQHLVTNTGDQIRVHVDLGTQGSNQGRFKAAYVTWWEPSAQLIVTVTPSLIMQGRPVSVTVHAVDSGTGAALPGGTVMINDVNVGTTDVPFNYTFIGPAPTGVVIATGYTPTPIPWPPMSLSTMHCIVTPAGPPLGRPIQLTIQAIDDLTGAVVQTAMVTLLNPVAPIQFPANAPYPITLHTQTQRGPYGTAPTILYPSASVSAGGYRDAFAFDLTV
jgi:hypothetical protein